MSDDALSPIVTEALDCFDAWASVEDKQRKREIEDLQFQVPELQWPAEARIARQAQVVPGTGTVSTGRPMLSIPKIDQPIQLILNSEKAAHLGVQVHPLTEQADEDTAEALQGLYRAIEVDSRANLARSWAFERAVKAGRGFYRILKEYDDDSDHPSDQKIVLKRIYEQGSVYLDPSATEPDGSDAERAIIVEDIPIKRYKRLYPKSKLASYSAEEFVDLGNERQGWVTGEKEGLAVRVAEFFYVRYEKEQVAWDGAEGKQSREKDKRVVNWCKLNAAEELESTVWDGRYIPIIRVVGRELIPFDGEKRTVGIIGPNKDAQRAYNYAYSECITIGALEGKGAPVVDPEAIEGFEPWWNVRNNRMFPYIPYRRFKNGRDLGPPVMLEHDTSLLQMNTVLLQQASDALHAGTAAFEPSLGQNSPNVKTKGATLALQNQSEQANSHWLDNLAEISMTHEARVVLELIPKVYDRPGRVARILDGEDNPKQVMFNAPFQMQGKRPMPVQQGQQPQGDVKHYDLTKGRYGVTVSVGKAYKSRVEQGKDELGQIIQADPQLFSILGDLYFKYSDAPFAKTASERMKKMLPPQLQDQDGQQAAQQAHQLQAENAALKQHLQELGGELAKDKLKVEGQLQKAKIDGSVAMTIQKMRDATSVAVAQIAAMTKGVQMQTEAQNEALATGIEQQHEADQAAHDRMHDVNQAVLEHQQALEAAQQGHDHAMQQGQAGAANDAALADQGHDHALEQGDASAANTMAAQAQAAEFAPEPEASA
jgi:hypothetical protein